DAARIYPASYWLAMLRVPTGDLSRTEALEQVKGCMMCHQLGNQATREIPSEDGAFASSVEAWEHRTLAGAFGASMGCSFRALGAQRAMFADWVDRVAAGEVPTEMPERPKGVERNLVVTQWDWGSPTSFNHTIGVSDRWDTAVNQNGRVWG